MTVVDLDGVCSVWLSKFRMQSWLGESAYMLRLDCTAGCVALPGRLRSVGSLALEAGGQTFFRDPSSLLSNENF